MDQFQYFYVVFNVHDTKGAGVLKQIKGNDGFNIAHAHEYLRREIGHPVLIENYFEITEKRWREFTEYMTQLLSGVGAPQTDKPQAPKASPFHVVPGGKGDEGTGSDLPPSA